MKMIYRWQGFSHPQFRNVGLIGLCASTRWRATIRLAKEKSCTQRNADNVEILDLQLFGCETQVKEYKS